jgi:hypothetical protein
MSISYFNKLSDQWRTAWYDKAFSRQFLVIASGLILVIFALGYFLDQIETRPGVILTDPLLQQFKPINLTWLTFSLIYLSVIIALFTLVFEPRRLLTAIQAYILLAVLRMLSMYLIPLDPPQLLIPLKDPFVESLSNGTLTRDLFFSGHTSTLFLLYLTAGSAGLRVFFLVCTILVGIFVLVQHVHYTIDVLAAPFYTYACYRISVFANGKLLKQDD